MNERALEILNRTLKNKFPFIRGIRFEKWNNHFNLNRINAHVDMDLSELADAFPDERVDEGYLEDVEYIIFNPFHIFDDFRENDLSINDLIKALSMAVGVEVYEITYHVSH